LGLIKGKKVKAEDIDDKMGRGRNYSFVAWKQYYALQHGDRESKQIEESAGELDMSRETDAMKATGAVDWQYDEGTELEFGGRSPMEEIESESVMSKRFKGSVLSG